MLMRKVQRYHKVLLLILVAALVSSCASTFAYRDIQKDFNNAVQAENVQKVEAVGLFTSSSLAGYEDVLARLNDNYIQSLDPRLKMNAYAMRAIAQWRTGKLSEAKQTAAAGLAPGMMSSSPRDKMVLLIIKPLVNEQDLEVRFQQLPVPHQVSWTDYQNIYAKDFADAAGDLKYAAAQFTPDLPEDVAFYVYFQRWRALQNWQIVLNTLPKDQREQGRNDAKKILGEELQAEIDKQKETIPPGHWLRRYIEFKEKQT